MKVLWKGTVSAWFQANRPKLCWNCDFPQNFHTRKLREITVFLAVSVDSSSICFQLWSSIKIYKWRETKFEQRNDSGTTTRQPRGVQRKIFSLINEIKYVRNFPQKNYFQASLKRLKWRFKWRFFFFTFLIWRPNVLFKTNCS